MTERGFLPPGPNEGVEWLGAQRFQAPVAPMKITWQQTPVMVRLGKGFPALFGETHHPTSLGAVLAATSFLNQQPIWLLPGMEFGPNLRAILLIQPKNLIVWFGVASDESFTKALVMMGVSLGYPTKYGR